MQAITPNQPLFIKKIEQCSRVYTRVKLRISLIIATKSEGFWFLVPYTKRWRSLLRTLIAINKLSLK